MRKQHIPEVGATKKSAPSQKKQRTTRGAHRCRRQLFHLNALDRQDANVGVFVADHILMVLEAAVPQFVPGICARILDDGKAIGRLETGIARGLVEATG